MVEKVLSSVKKETDRQYFFSRLNNPLWIKPLSDRGCFKNPPEVRRLPDGYVQYQNWPELTYLVNIAEEAAGQVVSIILGLPKTDNPRVYEGIFEIALKLTGRESAKLLPKIIEYSELEHQFFAYRYPELLQHWTHHGNINESIEVAKKIVAFRKDPRSRAKDQLRKKQPNDFGIPLEPIPRFDQWEYQQILEKGVRPLAEQEPYQVARILIDATASMIRLGMHQEDIDKEREEDYSEIWCRRLDMPDCDYQDARETLVHALTHACEQVFEKKSESIAALDQALRNQQRKLFTRLRQHLYALYPNDQTLSWIREFILGHDDYSRWEHHYEFQLMIRKASEHFGPRLLSEAEREAILNAILSGPPKEDFREWMGARYCEEAFQQRQRHFHRMQLRPFSVLLSGKYRRYFDELESEEQDEVISDDSYSPFKMGSGGIVVDQSPKSAEELETLTDNELLDFLNNWDDEHHDKDNWLVEINISKLAGVFQTFFKDRIVPNEERLAFWMAHRDNIGRPIYVAAMAKVMQELVKDKNFEKLAHWIEFCVWILSHPDSDREEGKPEPHDESREYPDWGRSRRAVVDFIDSCLNKDVDAPITARDGFANLLQNVCTQFDWWLDRERPVLLNRDDQIFEAINNTRSRALESLVNFGFWIRWHQPEDTVPEVTDILEKRLDTGAEIPFTRPEHAFLGVHFGNLCVLNRNWAAKQRKVLFPQDNMPVWSAAFGGFIKSNRPVKSTFDILREDFEFALEHLTSLEATKDSGKELVDRLGQHLFTYYLWQVYPLTGEESLLARFYEKTKGDRPRWANLFDYVGRSLRNSGKHLEKDLTDRAIAYFDWRLEVAEPLELRNFAFWLEAECLEPEWRLRSYSRILDLGCGKNVGLYMQVKTLNKLLPDHLSLVVECFAKITDAMDQENHLYILVDEVKPILKAGLIADDAKVVENAEHARENLLRIGRFDFLDIE